MPNKKNTDQDIERRTFDLREVRVAGDDEEPKIEGYAAVFNSLSEDLGGFYERIQPGAFKKTLMEADVRGLWNHDPNYVLGRTKSETLALREDELGLAFEIEPPATQWARDLLTSMRRGDIDQMSFSFRTIKDKWESVGDQIVRTLIEVKLFDVSPVTFPAYPQTSAQVRSAYESFVADNPTAEPGVTAHSEEDEDTQNRDLTSLANLRRLLDLAEKEI